MVLGHKRVFSWQFVYHAFDQICVSQNIYASKSNNSSRGTWHNRTFVCAPKTAKPNHHQFYQTTHSSQTKIPFDKLKTKNAGIIKTKSGGCHKKKQKKNETRLDNCIRFRWRSCGRTHKSVAVFDFTRRG